MQLVVGFLGIDFGILKRYGDETNIHLGGT